MGMTQSLRDRRKLLPEMQRPLPGMGAVPTLGLWRQFQPKPMKRKRATAAEKRLQAARRDPRQSSIFGWAHTEELTGQF